MSIIIKGMEMPVTGTSYVVVEGVYGDKYLMAEPNVTGSYFPIRQLQEEHGPLIDGNELEKEVLRWHPPYPCGGEKEYPSETDIRVSMIMEIEKQEIVVEAEG